jgi:hypothetical protein
MSKKKISKRCGNCDWWDPPNPGVRDILHSAGTCRDALDRAGAVVPFAINLDVLGVYSHGGKNCPCFKPKEKTDE